MIIIKSNERSVKIGEYIAENTATVRATAAFFNLSKTTVHKEVTEKLKNEDRQLYDKVRKVLDKKKAERHIRGGEATKNKYLNERRYGK